MSKCLIILRSPSGGGKTTFAKRFIEKCHGLTGYLSSVICSADYYFLRPDGTYDFNPKLLSNAHKFCYEQVKLAMESDDPWGGDFDLIILDNTNIKKKDYEPYIELAKKNEYEVREIVVGKIDPNDEELIDKYFKRNKHGVSKEKIKKMMQSFEF